MISLLLIFTRCPSIETVTRFFRFKKNERINVHRIAVHFFKTITLESWKIKIKILNTKFSQRKIKFDRTFYRFITTICKKKKCSDFDVSALFTFDTLIMRKRRFKLYGRIENLCVSFSSKDFEVSFFFLIIRNNRFIIFFFLFYATIIDLEINLASNKEREKKKNFSTIATDQNETLERQRERERAKKK